MNKPYDAELDQSSKPAEWAVLSWLFDAGFDVTDHPQGDLGPDIKTARFGKVTEEFIVEVEHMGQDRTDEKGDLIYSTLSVLGRRKLSDELPTLIFHVTHDMRYALIVFDRDFKCTPTKSCCPSRNNPQCEPKKYVPIERVLKVAIGSRIEKPFAELNAERVRQALANEDDVDRVRRILGLVRPYGINGVEYRRMLNRLTGGWFVEATSDMSFQGSTNVTHS